MKPWLAGVLIATSGLALASSARAGLALSPLIVDLPPDQPSRGDVEVLNTGSERLYVVVEPARIEDPGKASERRVRSADPGEVGLIAAPARLILEPGQRKFLRLAVLQPPGERDRVFRVTVKPVVGEVTSSATGLKILVGYDMLVIQRPHDPHADVTGVRDGAELVLSNTGDTNAELFRGRQCSAGACVDMPSERIYAGAQVRVPVKPGAQVTYAVKVGSEVHEQAF